MKQRFRNGRQIRRVHLNSFITGLDDLSNYDIWQFGGFLLVTTLVVADLWVTGCVFH